jgi:hypothetical protein
MSTRRIATIERRAGELKIEFMLAPARGTDWRLEINQRAGTGGKYLGELFQRLTTWTSK